MNSALYAGRVRHRRLTPAPHAFSYSVYYLLLDLEELPRLLEDCPFFSTRRPAPVRFRRADHLGDPAEPLEESVRSLVQERLGRRPEGRIELLTQPRTWGVGFNPVSFFYCYDSVGTLDAVVAEVSNTPWLERHCYVMDARGRSAGSLSFEFKKEFHVSPFIPMEIDYRWSFSRPGAALGIHMENRQDGVLSFEATMGLRRRPLDSRTLAAALAEFPFMTAKIVTAIYWQALLLKLKGAPFFTHPAKRATEAA
ncbi:MAG: DUF1365 domain-containing protein [Elusimicrobia bacterium]|nr:DUF1365 domain-containing protein [Elusimicrobiota bacterium]